MFVRAFKASNGVVYLKILKLRLNSSIYFISESLKLPIVTVPSVLKIELPKKKSFQDPDFLVTFSIFQATFQFSLSAARTFSRNEMKKKESKKKFRMCKHRGEMLLSFFSFSSPQKAIFGSDFLCADSSAGVANNISNYRKYLVRFPA